MKNILCFGDSNTFGTNPAGGRHEKSVRWTGRLQELLGREYYVIEEGMGGRTTVFDDPLEANRQGIMALPISLQSHKPLDLVILSLGTNDCKSYFHASAKVIARGMDNLCSVVERYDYGSCYPIPKILIISPIHIGEKLDQCPFVAFDETSLEKSKQLAHTYAEVAKARGCLLLDASKVAFPGEQDQLHMDGESHNHLAQAIACLIGKTEL